jgi:hypothetical protein
MLRIILFSVVLLVSGCAASIATLLADQSSNRLRDLCGCR